MFIILSISLRKITGLLHYLTFGGFFSEKSHTVAESLEIFHQENFPTGHFPINYFPLENFQSGKVRGRKILFLSTEKPQHNTTVVCVATL